MHSFQQKTAKHEKGRKEGKKGGEENKRKKAFKKQSKHQNKTKIQYRCKNYHTRNLK